MKVARFWTYPRHTWMPEGLERWGWPYWGGDEWGRRTVVVGFWFLGYLVWAYKTCHCEDCVEVREQAAREGWG